MIKERPLHKYQILHPSEMKEGYGYVKEYKTFPRRFIFLEHNIPLPECAPEGSKWFKSYYFGKWEVVSIGSYADCGLLPYSNGLWNDTNWIRDAYKQVCCQGIKSLFAV